MSAEMQLIELWRVIVAALLGGAIGLEREFSNKAAGLRTHMFVAGGSAIFVVLGRMITHEYTAGTTDQFMGDPIRIIQAIVVGVSFIGAGTIIQNERREKVRFLTTAASILFTAGTGIAAALDLWVFAVGVTGLALFISHVVKIAEHRLAERYEIHKSGSEHDTSRID